MGDARETEKAPDAFRTISEVAEDLELPQHVLRFWETRFAQIKPVKRAGGRRFYRPEDVDLLRGIRHLLYTDGYTIKGAQRILKDQGVRFVQDLGIEREVAVMRTARPRGPAGEGVTFGGLLGLLPRRRPRERGAGADDDILPGLPPAAELPLPFPDADADRDLDAEAPVPPIALRRPPPARPERAPPAERRRDPTFDAVPGESYGSHEPYAPHDPHDSHEPHEPLLARAGAPDDRRPAMRRAGPREPAPRAPGGRPGVAPGSRIEPELAFQRPTRGPAASTAQPAPRPGLPPEMDDPLLPFFDDVPQVPSSVSEPIEARIRRLKAQEERRPEREPPLGEPPAADGPPEEYIPARARRGGGAVPPERARDPAPPPRPAPAPAARHDGSARGARSERDDDLRDGDWRQTDWMEAEWDLSPRPGQGDARFPEAAAPDQDAADARQYREPSHAAGAYRETPHRETPYPDAPRSGPSYPEAAYHAVSHPAALRQRIEDAFPENRMVEHDRRRPPAHADRRDPAAGPAAPPRAPSWPEEDVRRAWGESAPQALPRATRVGPLIGPIDEEELPRLPERRPEPEPASVRRPAPWGQGDPATTPTFEAGPPPGPRGPREPLRPGPPEQYLPPHLRSEPRVVGQAPIAAPVLSRDDVHRLQSALYELGECRRLMEGLLDGEPAGDAG